MFPHRVIFLLSQVVMLWLMESPACGLVGCRDLSVCYFLLVLVFLFYFLGFFSSFPISCGVRMWECLCAFSIFPRVSRPRSVSCNLAVSAPLGGTAFTVDTSKEVVALVQQLSWYYTARSLVSCELRLPRGSSRVLVVGWHSFRIIYPCWLDLSAHLVFWRHSEPTGRPCVPALGIRSKGQGGGGRGCSAEMSVCMWMSGGGSGGVRCDSVLVVLRSEYLRLFRCLRLPPCTPRLSRGPWQEYLWSRRGSPLSFS